MKRKPTVALVLQQALDSTAGGVQRSTWQLGHYLARRQWEVVFISLTAKGHETPRVGTLRHPKEDVYGDRTRLSWFLEQTLRENTPSVVVNQIGLTPEPMRTLWQLRDVISHYAVISCFRNNPAFFKDNHRHIVRHGLRELPWVFSLIDHEIGWNLILAIHRWKNNGSFRKALACCDRFMLLSPSFKSELRWYLPHVDEDKLIAIPNGFQIPAAPRDGTKRNHLLFVGRLENAQKNVFMLPRLWKILQNRLPNWELHVVGDGEDRGELERLTEDSGLERIFFHGKRSPASFYLDAKIFLMLSAYEGFGNTLIESQMHGMVPVAFQSYSAIESMLNDGKDAVLVPAFDLGRFAEEVAALATDEDRWKVMSAAARVNAERFSEDVVGQQWHEVLSQLVQARTPFTPE
jgi:glycosyltransferase involved in cell wall biosynthesis